MNCESDDSEVEEVCRPDCETQMPEKSRLRYEKTYKFFKKWLNEKNLPVTEKTLLTYFVERSESLKSAGSLWAEYSMIKITNKLNDGIDISQFKKVTAFLKKKNIGHHPKKSKVFSREDINRFLFEAPDDDYLMMKVAMIIGIAGACRRDELTNMTIDDIEDKDSVVIVNIPSKPKTNMRRAFIDQVENLAVFRKYVRLRPENLRSRRFFYAMRKGKSVNSVVGINTMGQVPCKIAEYLKFENPQLFTGHAFRRTSSTLLTNTRY